MIQSPSGSSAVRSRRAASGAGSTTSKSARRTRPSLHPLHVAAVGVERDRPADAVDQRLRVAVVVVRPRDALLVVGRPTGSASCPSGTACPTAAAGTAPARTPSIVVRPHVASSPMWCGSSAISSVGRSSAAPAVDVRPGRHGRVGDGDAVAVARLGPGGVRPVGLEVDAVAGGVQRPLAADVGRRRDDGHARHPPLGEHPVGDVQPEGGLAGGGRRGGEEGVAGVVEDLRRQRPAARRAADGRWARTAGSGPPRGGEERRSRTSRDRRRYETRQTDPPRAKMPVGATSSGA